MKQLVDNDRNPYYRISVSEMQSYQKCPHRWYLSYVKGYWPTYKGMHLVLGSAFHYALELMLKRKIGTCPKDWNEKFATAVGWGHFNKYMRDYWDTIYPEEREKTKRAMPGFLPMFKGFHNFMKAYVPTVGYNIEETKNQRLKGDYGSMVKADYIGQVRVVDSIEERIAMEGLDWKTASQKKSGIPADYAFQLDTYATIADLEWVADVIFIKKTMGYQFLERHVTPQRKDLIRESFEAIGSQMNSGFAAPLGLINTDHFGKCSMCPFWRGKSSNIKDLGIEKTCKYETFQAHSA